MNKILKRVYCLLLSCIIVFGSFSVMAVEEDIMEETEEFADSEEVGSVFVDTDIRLLDSFSTQHPRILVNDFEPIRRRINENYMVGQWYSSVKRAADEAVKRQPYPYTVEDKAQHILTLSRNLWHDVYVLAFAYSIERNPVYKDRLWEQMKMVAEYPDWAPHSFLGTAETTHAVAVAYDWLYEDWTVEQRRIMSNAIVKFSFEPALLFYKGEGVGSQFQKMVNNWNAVCNGSLMMAAIAIKEDHPEISETIMQNAAKLFPLGLKAYRTDGAYPEGPNYWGYGTNYLTYCMATLDSAVAPGKSLPEELRFYEAPGLSETANYMIHIKAPNGTFNTGDANVGQTVGGPIMHWHAKKFNKPEYSWAQLEKDRAMPVTMAGYLAALTIIWYDPEYDNPGEHAALDKIYQSDDHVNLVLLQNTSSQNRDALYIGMQGGGNNMSHTYLSLGTFLLEANGVRWATMRGMGNYEWPNYGSRWIYGGRYQYYVTRAEGQNTLVINPDGTPDQERTAHAQVTRSGTSDNEAYGIIDLTNAYAKDVKSAMRGIRLFDNRSRVVVQDEVEAFAPIREGYWFMHTGADAQVSDDGKSVMLFQDGKRLRASIVEGHESAKFSIMDAKPLPMSPKPEVEQARDYGKKLAIRLDGETKFKLAVEFTPLYSNQSFPEPSNSSPDLKDWTITDESTSLGSDLGVGLGLMTDSPYAYFDRTRTLIDEANKAITVFEQDGTVMLPVKYLSSKFGAITEWNEEAKRLTVYYRSNTGSFIDGSTAADINGNTYEMDTPATVVNGRTFLPLRIVETLFGKKSHISDTGVILLNDEETELSSEKLARLFDALEKELGYSIDVSGKSVEFFNPDEKSCYVLVENGSDMNVSFKAFSKDKTVSNIRKENNKTFVDINGGEKQYEIILMYDPYEEVSKPNGVSSLLLSAVEEGLQGEEKIKTKLDIANIESSRSGTFPVTNLIDGSLDTLFTLDGAMSITVDFGQPKEIYAMGLSTSQGTVRKYYFELQKSDDGKVWENVLVDAATSGTSNLPDIIELGNIRARYIRYIGQGNSVNSWTSLSEMRFYGSEEQAKKDEENWEKEFELVVVAAFTGEVGVTYNIEIMGLLNNGTTAPISIKDFETFYIESDDMGVIELDKENMKFKASSPGNATITVNAVRNNLRYKTVFTLEVLN